MNETITAAIYHRPMRGAWLLDKQILRSSGDGIEALSALAESCCRWWEGRNSPLVHMAEQGLTEQSQRILRKHDPDELIALGTVSKKAIEDVDRILHPLIFSRPANTRTPISPADFQLHTIASLPSKVNLTRHDSSLFTETPPTLLLFAFGNECPRAVRNCVTLNFGTYSHTIRPNDGKPDFGFADKLWKDLPHRLYVLGSVDDLANALDEISGDFRSPGLRFVTPMQLAEGRHDARHIWPNDEKYHVFVGDSDEDADVFWHQPIVDESWRVCSRFRFYLPASLALDSKMHAPLQKWLARFTNAGSSQHRPPVFVSKSLTQEEIQRTADQLITDNRLGILSGIAQQWDTLQFPPNAFDEQPPVLLGELERSQLADILEMSPKGDTLRVSRPEILGDDQSGRWMADVFLEMSPQAGLPQRSHDSVWRLPPRRSQDLVGLMFHGAGRVKTNGYPSVAVAGHRPKITLRLPHPFNVFAMLIQGQGSYSITTDLRNELAQPDSTKFEIRVSDKGQQYRGTIDLFRNLGTAAHYFESMLWRQIFRHLASEKASADAALRTDIEGLLKKIYQGAESSLHAKAVSRIMGKIQGRSKEIRLTHLQMDQELKGLCSGARPFPIEQYIGNVTLHDDSACPYSDDTLRDGLTDLMARGVIEAGFEFTCNHCGFVSWLPLGQAAQRGECPACGTPWTAHAEKPWVYRLVPLAKRAVSLSGGAMPVLVTIWRLLFESKGSFLWQPNLEIFRPDHQRGEKPWGELDIVCLVDGKFVVGEVKNSIDDFGEHDFDDVRKICEAITPDIALLTFMEGEFEPKSSFATNLQKLQSQLAPLTTVDWRKTPSSW